MATLIQIWHSYGQDSQLRLKVAGACIKHAGTIRSEDAGTTNHANRLI
jgi:hypothetical protein